MTRHAGTDPAKGAVQLRELDDPTQSTYAAAVTDVIRIYLASFPDSERIPPEDLLDADSGRRTLLAVSPASSRVLGFCTFIPLPEFPAVLVEYLATDPLVRSSGLGSRLLSRCGELAGRSGAAHLFMELERPDRADSPEDAARRVAFYRRNGCDQVPWLDEYLVPDISDPQGTIAMLLFVKDLTEPPGNYEPSGLFEGLFETAYGEAGAHLLPRLLDAVRRGGR